MPAMSNTRFIAGLLAVVVASVWTPSGALRAAPPVVPPEVKIAAAQTAMGTIAAALEQFKTDNGRYPKTNEGLRSLLEKANTLPKWKGPYLKHPQALTDPWKRSYAYKFPGAADPKSFHLSSNGPDGRPDTGDDVLFAPAK